MNHTKTEEMIVSSVVSVTTETASANYNSYFVISTNR